MDSQKTQMRLSVLIPNFSRSAADVEMLHRAIASVRAHEPSCPILVVDDCSPFQPPSMIHASIFRRFENGGYSRAINSGLNRLREKGYTHVVTMNSDCEVTAPFLDVLREAFQVADIIGGRLLYPSGKVQSAGFDLDDAGRPIELCKGKFFYEAFETAVPRYCYGVTGAFQAFPLSIGNYSEAYELGFEDVEFCARAWGIGYKVAYIPTIQAIHYESETRGREPSIREIRSSNQWITRDAYLHDFRRTRTRISNLNSAQEK